MPSEHQGRSSVDRETFPTLQADIGEDPAWFLDRPLFDGDEDTSAPGIIIRARIRGIDSLQVIRAWRAVERALERGPRDRVLEMLSEREQRLEESGERPARTDEWDGSRPDHDVYFLDDAERVPAEEYESAHSQTAAPALTTDGGADDGE